MPASIIEKDYTRRRGKISAYGRAVSSYKTLKRLITAVALLLALLLLALFFPDASVVVRVVVLLAIFALCAALMTIWYYSKYHFIEPGLATRKWIQQVCDGELEARIDLPEAHSHYKELDFHTRNLTTSLKRLSTDMEGLVDLQTKRLEAQNQVVELLFKLAADVAGEVDLQSVMNKVCNHLSDWLNDANIAAYIIEDDGLKLNASSGPAKNIFLAHRPLTELPEYHTGLLSAVSVDSGLVDVSHQGDHETETLKIPIFKHKDMVGMVEIVASTEALSNRREKRRVFQTVSEQLSVFVLKDSVLESAHNTRLIKARTQLGADLHDSLAQTLLATGYQVKMLGESVQKTVHGSVKSELTNDLQRIEGMINEANAELRSLIGEYRKPLTEHRYADQLGKIIDEFNKTSSIEVFFQLDNPGIVFTAREETVIQRIVGEALNNARKYSEATTIRVYIHTEASGARCILIEDDGRGFCIDNVSQLSVAGSGEHIGLAIMRDRALSIGAILTVDSELEEGTRVFLKLPPLELSQEVVNAAERLNG